MAPDRPSSRDILLATALTQFGRQGFDGTTTRAIAEAANMPMSQITYHFGGKEGLYLGCAQMIADYARGYVGPTLDAVRAEFAADPGAKVARDGIARLLGTIAEGVLDPVSHPFFRFILREQAEPTEAFGIIYGGAMGSLLELLAQLVAALTGQDGIEARVRAITLLGQIGAFRVFQASVLRLTGWDSVGAAETALIRATVLDNVEAICAALERGASTGTSERGERT